MYEDSKFERKPSGIILINDVEKAHTMQCCHCNAHFVSVKGSGKKRGYCLMCMAITCGHVKCGPCIPFEKKLLELEEK